MKFNTKSGYDKYCSTFQKKIVQKKNGVRIVRTGVLIARTGRKKKGVPNARTANNFQKKTD